MSPPPRKKRRGAVKARSDERPQKNPAPPESTHAKETTRWARIRGRVPFSASARAVLGWSDSALRATLVHEATHLVFTRNYLALSGLEPRELILLETGCSDIAMAVRVLNEAIAYRNEALWYEAQGSGRPPDTERKALVYSMALDAERGDEAKVMAFVRYLRNYAEAAVRPDLRRGSPEHIDCGPPIAFRGERHGSVVFAFGSRTDNSRPVARCACARSVNRRRQTGIARLGCLGLHR